MGNGTAIAEDIVTLDDALVLLDEIERLRGLLVTYEQRLKELDELAHRDALVGLANRRSFVASLERSIANTRRHGSTAAVILADVDRLKAINDTYGHDAGDKALVEVSRLLVASVRGGDRVARLAGDEFGILLDGVDELGAWQLALRIVETVDDQQFRIDQVRVPLSVAVGAAVILPADDVESVLKRADKELYKIKGAKNARPQS